MNRFTATVDEQGPHRYVVALVGELDLAHANSLSEDLSSLITSGALIVLDAHELTFMDSSGLRILLQIAARAEKSSATLRLAAPHPAVQLVLNLTGAAAILDTRADVAAALAD